VSGNDVIALITGYRDGTLALHDVLEGIPCQGNLSDVEYEQGVALLCRMQVDHALDPATTTLLLQRLVNLHVRRLDADDVTIRVFNAPDVDVTITRTGSVTAHAWLAGRDRGPEGGHAAEDATVRAMGRRSPQNTTLLREGMSAHEETITRKHAGALPTLRSPGEDSTRPLRTSSAPVSTTGWVALAGATASDVANAGTQLKGRFLLEKELGRGGMGVVYLARDERQVEARDRDPYIAVKVLNDEFRRHPDSLIALQREARRSQRLAHDNIVRVYDFDKDGTIVFMTMEYIDGTDLRTLIRERARTGMPLSKAWTLIEGMVAALARAHALGIVHSDFKPGNVMVTAEGVPKVFDFGIARAATVSEAAGEQTVFDATTLGALTPAYASLEMIHGGEPSPSDDVYALGCVCYELLTGKHPFGKASAEVALRERKVPPPVSGLSRRQARTLRRAVAFRAEDRLPSVEAFLEGMRHVPLRRRLKPLLVYGAVIVLAIVGIVWQADNHRRQQYLAALVTGFTSTGSDAFADEDAVSAALSRLDEDDRDDFIVRHNGDIVAYLLQRLERAWRPEQARYDYAAVLRVRALRREMRVYSPELDALRTRIDLEKDARLNDLDNTLEALVREGALFLESSPNVVEVLEQVRLLDADSVLLHKPALEKAYEQAIADALNRGDVRLARERLDVALEWQPGSRRLKLQESDVELAEMVAAHPVNLDDPPALDARQARTLLDERIASPSADMAWQADVRRALAALDASKDPGRAELRAALARSIASAASAMALPAALGKARFLVAFGLEEDPESTELQTLQTALIREEDLLKTELEWETVETESTVRVESLRLAIVAGDLVKARRAFERLRELQPDSYLVRTEMPKVLADAHLAVASRLLHAGHTDQAIQTIDSGIEILGERSDLRAARERHAFIAWLVQARLNGTDQDGRAQLTSMLASLRRRDAAAVEEMERALHDRGLLDSGSFDAELKALDVSRPQQFNEGNVVEAGKPGTDTATTGSRGRAR